MTKYVYRFGGDANDGGKGDKNLLGGKGANLAEMASIGLPVPPGFTITTEMCTRYLCQRRGIPRRCARQVPPALAHIEGVTGKRFGDAANPLLVSVRSGARASMPGMMDTVLNLGLNDETVKAWRTSGDARFAYDSYRRFIQMYSDVVLDSITTMFEDILETTRKTTASPRHRPGADDWKASSRSTRPRSRSERQAVPAGPARAALGRDRRRVRQLDERAPSPIAA
jgi:pyruvate,orthophosphate dikinase